MGRLDGRVVFITGAARGQGRSHALHAAEEGAAVIGVDICEQLESVHYPMPSVADLDETAKQVADRGGRMVARVADVRDQATLAAALAEGVEEFGHVDAVVANAGVMTHAVPSSESGARAWEDSLAVMLTGVWNTLQVCVPAIREHGRGGSIVITSSSAGIRPAPTDLSGGHDGYVAAKFGVVGLMRTYALGLAAERIRVNTVHPTGVATPMVVNDFFRDYLEANPGVAAASQNPLPVTMLEPSDVSKAVVFLLSDDARWVTGSEYRVDAGLCL
jgi:SDR family mycofactocin-dependent oxidoreductase